MRLNFLPLGSIQEELAIVRQLMETAIFPLRQSRFAVSGRANDGNMLLLHLIAKPAAGCKIEEFLLKLTRSPPDGHAHQPAGMGMPLVVASGIPGFEQQAGFLLIYLILEQAYLIRI